MLPELLLLNSVAIRSAELIKDNEGDDEFITAINAIQPGQTLHFGGGAAPLSAVTAPSEVEAGLFIFFYEKDGAYIAKVYRGVRAVKPFAWYRFRSDAERATYVARMKKDETDRLTRVETRKTERKAVVRTIKIGDILHYSWGWEQTNCDFFQVVGLTAKGVKIREIAGRQIPSKHDTPTSMSCQMEAVPNEFVSENVLTKRMVNANSVRMDHGNASLWDGNPKYCSWYA